MLAKLCLASRAAFATLGLFALLASPAAAQTLWLMPTEYPASAIPGEGVATFAAEVAQRTGGRLTIAPSYDAAFGLRSAEIPLAVRDRRIEAGDAFAGALSGLDPIFGLSSLPLVVGSREAARRLADEARPAYEATLARIGQHLLYVTPWPPSGIWSRRPIETVSDLRGLSVRTYDATSTAVMNRAGARALAISFADAQARVKDGTVDAVLSSGDGGAGRRLWELLPHFTAIEYATPLSLATVGLAAYRALDPDTRDAVDAAAAATERRQWAALETRLDENHRRMRENGVAIRTEIDPDVRAALAAAGAEAVAAWRASVGPDRSRLLDVAAGR